MSLDLLHQVFAACDIPVWSRTHDAITLTVKGPPITFELLKALEEESIFACLHSSPVNAKAQADFNANKLGDLVPQSTFTLTLPRVVSKCVVAQNLTDLLSIGSAAYTVPKSYFLLSVEDSGKPFCFTNSDSLSKATSLVKRYHDAIRFWNIIESLAEHSVTATPHLLFFGIPRIEIAPQ
jgi:hypothetical protein